MRSMFPSIWRHSLTTKEALIKEIRNLNDRVANFSVDRIVSQLGSTDTYLKDISSMPRPLDHPKYDNKRNYTYDTSNIISNN